VNEDLNKTVGPQKPLIFYHSADLDGKCSAAIALRYEKQCWNRDCELYPINYGDTFPWDKITAGRRVYMLDFSLQPFDPNMYRLANNCDLIWVDHHKTALDEWIKGELDADGELLAKSKLNCVANCQLGKAGCELTWELLYNQIGDGASGDTKGVYVAKMPHAVMLLGRFDVWDEKCALVPWSHILAFQYGMRLRDAEPRSLLWLELFGDSGIEEEVDRMKAICAGGNAVLAYDAKQNEIAMSACSFETTFESLRALAANRGPTNSKLFESKWDPEKHDIMISFYWSHRGEWKVSLYTTKPDIDCGALCKKHGGGGHPKAAGFQCKELPFAIGPLLTKPEVAP